MTPAMIGALDCFGDSLLAFGFPPAFDSAGVGAAAAGRLDCGWLGFQTMPHAGQRTFAIADGTLAVVPQPGHWMRWIVI